MQRESVTHNSNSFGGPLQFELSLYMIPWQSCFRHHQGVGRLLPSSDLCFYVSGPFGLFFFGKKPLAITAINAEFPPFENGKHNSESVSTLDRDISPLISTQELIRVDALLATNFNMSGIRTHHSLRANRVL